MISSTLKQQEFRLLKMNTLGERLREVMRELEIETPRALADYCGVSEGLVSQWFSGQTKLGAKPLRALAKTQFNLDWITTGALPKYRKDDNELYLRSVPMHAPPDVVSAEEIIELVVAYKSATKKDRKSVMSLAKTAAERAAGLPGVTTNKK